MPVPLILLPEDDFNRLLALAQPPTPPPLDAPAEYDFIQHYYGKADQTHQWNRFHVKPSVVQAIRANHER